VTSFFEIKVCVFFETDKTVCYNFLGFRKKHLFITTCIEKQCTWPFSFTIVKHPFFDRMAVITQQVNTPLVANRDVITTSFCLILTTKWRHQRLEFRRCFQCHHQQPTFHLALLTQRRKN